MVKFHFFLNNSSPNIFLPKNKLKQLFLLIKEVFIFNEPFVSLKKYICEYIFIFF